MKDRVPKYPGRVKLVPVSGQENTFDMVRADEPTQTGDSLNKNTLLRDQTAAMFGMGENDVPDDVFAWLGKYNQHWWGRRVNLEKGGYVAKPVPYSPGGTTFLSYWGKVTITASAQYEVDFNTGEITLLNPVTVVSDANSGNLTEAQVNSLRGKYCKGLYCTGNDGDTDRILFFEQNADVEWRWNSSSTECGVRVNGGLGPELVSEFVSNKTIGDWDYLYSADRNAFPDSGIVSGYEYSYLGIPFNNAVTAPKIATGSYVGTGTYGANNPNSLTFDFAPKFFMILNSQNTNITWCQYAAIGIKGNAAMLSFYRAYVEGYTANSINYPYSWPIPISFNGNTVSWYNTKDALSQQNYSGISYQYIAIG